MTNPMDHLDYEALNELKGLMEDEFAYLIETYLNDSEQRVKSIEEAYANRDGEAMAAAAHSFKGSSVNIGALRLSSLCLQLELKGKAGELDGLEEYVSSLKPELAIVRKLLQDFVAEA